LTATYTNNPSGRQIDAVRFAVDDKDCIPETDAALSDEEIQYLIDSNNHILLAAASAAERIGAKYSSDPQSKTVDDFTITYGSGRQETYGALAKRLRAEAAKAVGAKIYAGGISKSDKDAAEADTDRVLPQFSIGMDDNETTDPSIANFT